MRMNRYVWILLIAACNGSPGPPETPATTSTVEAQPPPTTTAVEPSGPLPEEYFPLDRIESVRAPLTAELQENAWAGRLDPLYVAEHCAWALEPHLDALFPMTREEMLVFASEGGALDSDGGAFVARLSMTNRRCDPEHVEHDPRFCGRSEVRRNRLSEFRADLVAHLETARALRNALNGQPGHGSEWDSIRGWCSKVER